MDKLKRKQTMFSVLRAVAYFAGFPLLLLVVLLGSTQFRHSAPFLDSWYMGLVICAIPWLLTAILQIVFGAFVKNQNLKTIVIVLVTVAVMVGSAGIIDIYGASVIKKEQEKYSSGKYASSELEINDYYKQVNWYVTLTDKESYTDEFMKVYDRFISVYNLKTKGGKGSSRSDKNTDGSPAVKGTEKGLGLENVYVSPNGLLSDGWIFSVKNAIDIISIYDETIQKAEAAGIDLEEKYDSIINTVKNGDEYQAYMATDEYKAAYGEDGTAYHYMIGEDKLNRMVPVIAKYLAVIITDVANIMPVTASLINNLIDFDALNGIKNLDDLVTFANNTIVVVANNSMVKGILDSLAPGSNPLLDPTTDSGYLELDKQFILDLAADFTYYVSPQARPIFDFIAETTTTDGEGNKVPACDIVDGEGNVVLTAAEVQRFAYARYYGQKHGANIGSVLIPTKTENADGTVTYSNIGQITMNTSGYPAEFAFSLKELYTLDAGLDYIPQLYPILVPRRYLYVFAGICALCMMLFYQFLRREEETRDEMIVQGGATL